MKLKGIKPIEQHVEKIVLGVAGAAFVGALGYQFLVRKNEVKVGSSTVPISDVYAPAKDAARRLREKVESQSPTLPEMQQVNLAGRMALGKDAFAKVLASDAGRVPLGAKPGLTLSGVSAIATDAMYAPLTLPAPSAPVIAVHRAAIHPGETLLNPELASLLPAQQPMDKASVGIEASIDGAAIRAMLENDPDGPGPLAAYPLSWWRDPSRDNAPMVEVLSFQVERKTLRTPDGASPDNEVVILPAMAGRPGVLSEWEAGVRSAGDVPYEIARIAEMADQVQRPEFYSVISGPEWVPPSEVVIDEGEKGGQQTVLRNSLRLIDRQIRGLRQRLGEAGGPGGGRDFTAPGRQTNPRQAPNPRGGGGGGRMSGGGGGGGGDRGREDQVNSNEDLALEAARKRLERLVAQRERVQQQLDALTGTKTTTTEVAPESEAINQSFLDKPKARLWTSDLSAQPGATYAYRVRLIVNNPLFGRNLKSEQASLGESSLVSSPWTEWSQPVTVDRDGEFFVTSAESQNALTGRATATAEMFVFYYGYYRSTTQSISPGDSLSAKVTMPDMRFVNMDEVRSFIETNGVLPPVDPLIRTEQRTTRPAPNQPGQAGGEEATPPNPFLGAAAPKSLPRDIAAVLLGVREVSGGKGEAVVRDQDQSVRAFNPETARASVLYKRMKASADAARDLLKQEQVEEAEVAPIIRDRDVKIPRGPRNTSGGGGGGGGGG